MELSIADARLHLSETVLHVLDPCAVSDKTERFGGKQFSTAPPKSGKAPDAYIDKQVRSLALVSMFLQMGYQVQHGNAPGDANAGANALQASGVQQHARNDEGKRNTCLCKSSQTYHTATLWHDCATAEDSSVCGTAAAAVS